VKTQGEFLKQFLLMENVQRYAQHSKLPLWMHLVYFPLVAIGLSFPWFPLSLGAFGEIPNLTKDQREWHKILRVWALLPIFVFYFSQTKNPQYVLLSIPAFTTLAAVWSTNPILVNERKIRIFWLITMLFAALLLFLLQPLINSNPDWHRNLTGNEPVVFGWGLLAIGFLLLAIATFIALPRRLFNLLTVMAVLGIHLLALTTFIPKLGHYRQEPLKHFAQMASLSLGSKDLIVVYRRDPSSVVFYSNRRVLRIDDPKQLNELRRSNF
ncbi:MAG: hypothetical protein RMK89_14020, partial [Armatimonadota bacterium]|nr:hypothetical protein [Armatimonadota bacterium]MDW8144562.1 hypothetical protein [Armatimonadota bacterium]